MTSEFRYKYQVGTKWIREDEHCVWRKRVPKDCHRRDIKNSRKRNWTLVGGVEMWESGGAVLIFWVHSRMNHGLRSVLFPFCSNIYRCIMSIFISLCIYSFGFFTGMSKNDWIFLKRGSIDLALGKTLGICSN